MVYGEWDVGVRAPPLYADVEAYTSSGKSNVVDLQVAVAVRLKLLGLG